MLMMFIFFLVNWIITGFNAFLSIKILLKTIRYECSLVQNNGELFYTSFICWLGTIIKCLGLCGFYVFKDRFQIAFSKRHMVEFCFQPCHYLPCLFLYCFLLVGERRKVVDGLTFLSTQFCSYATFTL